MLRCPLTSIGNPIVEIILSYDRLISTMGIAILVRRHIYIESGPRAGWGWGWGWGACWPHELCYLGTLTLEQMKNQNHHHRYEKF